MKALSLKQPWANAVACGDKTIETRFWKTDYRGPLLIVASKTVDERASNLSKYGTRPRGKAVAQCMLIHCRPMRPEDEEKALCPCRDGLFAWILNNVERVQPFEVKGRLKLFDVPIL